MYGFYFILSLIYACVSSIARRSLDLLSVSKSLKFDHNSVFLSDSEAFYGLIDNII